MKFTNKVLKLAQKYEMLAENSEEEFEDSEPSSEEPLSPQQKESLYLQISQKLSDVSDMLASIDTYTEFENVSPNEPLIQTAKEIVDHANLKIFQTFKDKELLYPV